MIIARLQKQLLMRPSLARPQQNRRAPRLSLKRRLLPFQHPLHLIGRHILLQARTTCQSSKHLVLLTRPA